MAEIKETGYNLAAEMAKLHIKYEDKSEEKIQKLINGIEALNTKLEWLVDLRLRLLKDGKDAPEYVEYSREEDPQICDLIDLYNQETGQEINHDRDYRLTAENLQDMEVRLPHLCQKYDSQLNLEQNKLHPLMLEALSLLQIATNSLRAQDEHAKSICRKQNG